LLTPHHNFSLSLAFSDKAPLKPFCFQQKASSLSIPFPRVPQPLTRAVFYLSASTTDRLHGKKDPDNSHSKWLERKFDPVRDHRRHIIYTDDRTRLGQYQKAQRTTRVAKNRPEFHPIVSAFHILLKKHLCIQPDLRLCIS